MYISPRLQILEEMIHQKKSWYKSTDVSNLVDKLKKRG